MSEAVQDAVIEETSPLANPEGKSVEELMEIAKVLQVQVNDANSKASRYQALGNREVNRGTKAQGALEVILQLIPRDRVEAMIKAEEEAAKESNKTDDN